MKRFTLLLSLVVMLLATSCELLPISPIEGGGEETISFSAKIAGATRATDLQFESGDEISVFASTTEALSENNYAQNVLYKFDGNAFTSNSGLWYPSESEDLTFFAVYPYGEYTTPSFTFSVNLDQRTHAAYTKSDLMTAAAKGNNSDVVALTFNHCLAKVVINIVSDNMPVGEQSLTFKGVKRSVAANLNSNTFQGVEGSTADIVASPNGTNSFKAILPSQAVGRGSEFVEIVIGDQSFIWTLDQDLVFNSGVEYIYTLELIEGASVMITPDINPWKEPDEIESVVPDEYLEILEPYIEIHKGSTPPNVEGTYFISPNVLVTDNVGFDPGHIFADDYVQFYNQTADNRISGRSTQLLGDLKVSEGSFISGSGNDFTIYFNTYSTHDNGSWLIKATIISGTMENGVLKNYTQAFLVLDDYDTVDQYMEAGQYRVLCDSDGESPTTTWPLDDTRTVKRGTGVSIYSNKK